MNSGNTQYSSNMIAKSQPCTRSIEDQFKKRNMKYNIVIVALTIPFLIIIFKFFDSAIFFPDELIPYLLVLYIVGFVCMITMALKQKQTKESYESYLYLAEKENLIIEDTGVYGSYEYGNFEIPYSQIKSVWIDRPQTNVSLLKPWILDNPVLIVDAAGKCYSFYTFEGAGQLATILEKQLRIYQNDKKQRTAAQANAPHPSTPANTDYYAEDVGITAKPIITGNNRITCPSCGTDCAATRKRCSKCGTFFE